MAPQQALTAAGPLVAGMIALGLVRATRALRDLYPDPLPAAAQEQAAPRHDPRLLTAAALLDHSGIEVSDFLLPYEVLAASGAFKVYATAPDPRLAVLTGGLDVVPDALYVRFARLPVKRADLVVVPHMPTPAPTVISSSSRLLAPRAGTGQADPPGATTLPDSGLPYAAFGEALDDLTRYAGHPIARFAAKRLEHRSTPGTP